MLGNPSEWKTTLIWPKFNAKIQLFQILLAFVGKISLLCIEIGEKPESKWLVPICDKTHTTILLLPLVR